MNRLVGMALYRTFRYLAISYTIQLKPHTHEAIHNRADRTLGRSPIGMRHWNEHV